MARRLASRRSGDEEEILSGWHKRRKGADRRRSDTEDDGDGDCDGDGFRYVDEKVRACLVFVRWRSSGPMAEIVPQPQVLPCDLRGRPKAQDAPENVRAAAADGSSRLAATSPARRGV